MTSHELGDKRPPPVLTTQRLTVRLATYRDAAAIAHYYQENRAFLQSYEPTRSPRFYTPAFWQVQVEQNRLQFEQDLALRLFLFEHSAPTLVIGVVNFTQFFREPFHACLLGYSLAQTKQRQGLMQEALEVAIDYLFHDLNFHRVMANYMPRNQRSGNLLRRLGFVIEGYARDYLQINGKWEDHVLTSRTNPKWHSSTI